MNAPTKILPAPLHPQYGKVERLIAALEHGLVLAARGELFDSVTGMCAVNAAHDLSECDALYDMANDIGAPLGMTADRTPVLSLSDSEVRL